MYDVAVLGSINMDTVVGIERMPKVGETLMGEDVTYLLGGKGCNQAVAASRVGSKVTMLGAVGTDAFGEKALGLLSKESLDVSQIKKDQSTPTGIATVLKYPDDNSIIVIPGANGNLNELYLEEVKASIINSKVLLLQQEIPLELVEKSLTLAKENNVMTVLNPAPFNLKAADWFDLIDVITPNETEFNDLCDTYLDNPGTLEENMIELSSVCDMTVIVTLGSKGIAYVLNDEVKYLDNITVEVVDTTGAGDTFNGILAGKLAEGIDFEEALVMANVGASLSTEKFGAQTGMPTMAEIENRRE